MGLLWKARVIGSGLVALVVFALVRVEMWTCGVSGYLHFVVGGISNGEMILQPQRWVRFSLCIESVIEYWYFSWFCIEVVLVSPQNAHSESLWQRWLLWHHYSLWHTQSTNTVSHREVVHTPLSISLSLKHSICIIYGQIYNQKYCSSDRMDNNTELITEHRQKSTQRLKNSNYGRFKVNACYLVFLEQWGDAI